jgi:hypothetical protein
MAIPAMSSLASLRSRDLPTARGSRGQNVRKPLEIESPRAQEDIRHSSSSTAFAYALPEFISAVQDIRTKPSYFDKGRALQKAYETGKTLASNTNEIINIVEVAEQLADKKISWTGPLSWILLPLQSLALATGIYRVYQTNTFRKELNSHFHTSRPEETARARTRVVQGALQFLQTKNEKTLRAHLAFGDTSSVTEKINALSQKLTSRNAQEKAEALQEGEALMQKLKARVKNKMRFEIAATIMRVVTITLSVLLLTTPPGAILSTAVIVAGAIGSGIKAFKKKALPENPKYLLPQMAQRANL